MRYSSSGKIADFTKKWKVLIAIILSSSMVTFGRAESNLTGLACLSNPCVHGICLNDANNTFHCYCIDGYTGLLCQTNWDECWSDPCLNGGICTDGIAQYNCTCPQGYQGDHCEVNIDECVSNPCRNNGTCIDGSNGYACVCPSGYLGNFCETDVSVCNDTWETRCLNGGLCTEGPGFTFDCVCPLGWFGRLCEEAVDECTSSPCQNGAICLDLQADYVCACPFGFTGRNCEVELEMCGDSSPCQNGALCLVEDWLRICYCVPDYHGERCQYRYNECLLGPGCRNGGTCIDGVDGYNCSCPPGWSGNFCECQIVSEGEMICDYLFPTIVKARTLPPKKRPTVPIWNQVPKTSPRKTPSSTSQTPSQKETSKTFLPPYPTECFPMWWRFTEAPSRPPSTLSKEVPGAWLTKSVYASQGTSSTRTTKVLTAATSTMSTPAKTTSKTTTILTAQMEPKITTEMKITLQTTPATTTTEITSTKTQTTSTKTTTPTTNMTASTKTTSTTTQSTSTKTTTPTTNMTASTKTTSTTTQSTSTKTIMPTTNMTTSTETASTTTQTTPTITTTETISRATQAKPILTTAIMTPTTTTMQTASTKFETKPTATTTETKSTTIEKRPTTTTTETTSTTIETTMTTTTTETTSTTVETQPITITVETTSTKTTLETIPMTTITQTTLSITPVTSTSVETTKPTTTPETTFASFSTESTLATTGQTIPVTETKDATKSGPIQTTCITAKKSTKTTTEASATSEERTSSFLPPTSPLDAKSRDTSIMPAVFPTPQKPWNCRMVPCRNGGTCLATTNGPRCLCKAYWEGSFCETTIDIKVARFSKNSYLVHKLTSTDSINIEVTARTLDPEGVILYSHLGADAFLILYLEDGLLKFKFSCGVQTMVLREMQYLISNGFEFVASVTLDFLPPIKGPFRCSATVRINNTLAMSGEQMTKGPRTDSGFAWVYVGGVPSRFVDPEEVPVSNGFSGCMKNLVIDKKIKKIFKDSFDSIGISECKSLACFSNPCRSGSTCVEHNNTWTCLCPTGFLGHRCEISVCENNLCQFGGTCVSFPGSGFLCLCPFGKQGLFCEKSIDIKCPIFSSSVGGLSSFAAYKIPTTEIYRDLQLTFKFVPHDMEQISLMLFMGQDGYHGAKSDHLAVSFIKGYIVLTWNLGSGPRRIFTQNPVSKENRLFHTVRIGRIGQRAWLVVDNQANVTGKSPGKLTQLNTRSMVFLGGHPSKNFSLLPHDLPLHTGFSGCLFDVELRTGQILMKIEKSTPAFSRGMGQCGATLCNGNSCENGGGCINHGATYTCLCADGWFGPTCSTRYNPCDSIRHNCSEGSTCVPLREGFSCDCPVGKTGKFCEIDEELSDVKLKGIRSYLALSVEGLHQYQSCVDLEIKPLSNHGLLLYSGRFGGNSFWSLSLQDGMVDLRVSPGVRRTQGDILVIRSRRLLALGKWHRIRAGRYGRRLFLWVEGTVSTGVLLPGETLPPSGSIVYLGGFPDLSKLPLGVSGRILKPFEGCIRKFGSGWRGIPLTKSNILEGRNVEDCDGTVCGGDVCHNGGTCHVDINNKPLCACLKQYTGKRCEFRLSCKQTICHNGGRCADEGGRIPQCQCPNGWAGPFCESALSAKAPKFGGNSYMLIDRSDSKSAKKRAAGNKFEVSFIYLNFTSPEANGFLLWSSSESSAEYVGIGMEREKVKLVWAWEGREPTVVVPHGQGVADGSCHDLSIAFDSSNVTVRMDRRVVYHSSASHPGHPPATDGKFFLGGFPERGEIGNRTFGHFQTGFNGCLHQLAWEIQSPISNFSKFEGENIRACDPFGV